MAKIINIQQLLLSELNMRASRRAANMPMVKRQLIVNKEANHFVLMAFGWAQSRYVHQCLIHLELKDNKIWIHEDLTDPGIFDVLLENGVPARDIVLGYVSEIERGEQIEVM